MRPSRSTGGGLPLLAPMSEVAGRMATQIGAHFLERDGGGRGVLLGGAPGRAPGPGRRHRRRQRRVELGVDRPGHGGRGPPARPQHRPPALRRPDPQGPDHDPGLEPGAVERAVADADLVIGAVLVAGGRAPVVVTEDMVRGMKQGAVIVDIAIDQGGCVETIRETTHADPVYELHGVLHYGVGNVPAAVPHTSTYALTNATLPYIAAVAEHGPLGRRRSRPGAAGRREHRRRPRDQPGGGRGPRAGGRGAAHRPGRVSPAARRSSSRSSCPGSVSNGDARPTPWPPTGATLPPTHEFLTGRGLRRPRSPSRWSRTTWPSFGPPAGRRRRWPGPWCRCGRCTGSWRTRASSPPTPPARSSGPRCPRGCPRPSRRPRCCRCWAR